MQVRLFRSLAAASLTATMILAITAPRAEALSNTAGNGRTDPDHLSPVRTAVTGSSTNVTFMATVNGVPVTVTCTSSTFSGTTLAAALWFRIAPPTFSGCTDNAGGTDTVTTNSTNGSWVLVLVDRLHDETGEVSGDRLRLKIPQAGLTVSSSILTGCTGTFAPTGAHGVRAAYDDVSQATITNATVPLSGTGCTTSPTVTMNATYTLSPGISDVS